MFTRYVLSTFLPAALLLAGCALRLNRLNRHGERTGKWLVYLDSARTVKSMEGRFRNGRPVGKALYYDMQGRPERREINRFGRMRTTIFHSNGRPQLKGMAQIKDSADRIHYFFYGRWKQYDTLGRLVKYKYYERGRLVRTEYSDKSDLSNDSLIGALNALEQRFNTRDGEIADKINRHQLYPKKAEQFREELLRFDPLLFEDLARLLQRYGYPSKAMAGDSHDIPFYLLSFAPAALKEKHLPMLWQAARRGDVDSIALAFYIDKMKVARGEKQVYGTQFYIDREKQEAVYYPSVEPERLGQRRKEMRLEE